MTNNNFNLFPKILIVGTLPYDPNESSRALDTYFHNWPKSKLRMIFSNSEKPKKGHCCSFYQITDNDVFRNLLKNKKRVGRTFCDSDISDSEIENKNKKANPFLKILKRKNWLRFYLRKCLWGSKRWLSNHLLEWVDEFSPDIVYICFSDDYFILDISLFFANRYNVPIVAQIGDDYYFKQSSFLLKPYMKQYKKLFDKIMETDGFGVYISDKLTQKYNSHFKKKGFPIYLSSSIENNISDLKYVFNYFGKTDLGRFKSLGILADSLNAIDDNFYINVYSNFKSKRVLAFLNKHHCVCHPPIPYSKVKETMNSGCFNVIASGFGKKDIEATRYSLSTKIADSLISCGPIIAVGPKGDGAIDYLLDKKCAIVITDKKVKIDHLKTTLFDKDFIGHITKISSMVYYENHSLEKNRHKFEDECVKLKICLTNNVI